MTVGLRAVHASMDSFVLEKLEHSSEDRNIGRLFREKRVARQLVKYKIFDLPTTATTTKTPDHPLAYAAFMSGRPRPKTKRMT